jgi:hypothetical protein
VILKVVFHKNFSCATPPLEKIIDMGGGVVECTTMLRRALETPVGFITSEEYLILRASIWKHACTLLIAETGVLFGQISNILSCSVVRYHLEME